MALAVGSRLGHDDVTALIGEGGMGQVYRVTDTKLAEYVQRIVPTNRRVFSLEPHVTWSGNPEGEGTAT